MKRSFTHYALVPTVAGAVFAAAIFSAAPKAYAGSGSKIVPLIGAGILVLGAAAALKAQQQRERARARARARRHRTTPRRVRHAPRTRAVRRDQYSRQQIVTAQTALAELGYYSSTIDGLNGRGTRQAVAEYQKESGYNVTGYLSRDQYATLVTVGQAPAPAAGPAPIESADQQQSQQGYGGAPVNPVAAPVAEGTVPAPGTAAPEDPASAASQSNPGSSVVQTR
jgi:peptidoglycan hydrolase-like protein with peptidoglycan-binding domain